jgi:hypothetical protein
MSRKDSNRVELDDRSLTTDRRVTQRKGEIDVSQMDAEDIRALREEEISNVDENELDQLEAEAGIARGTEDSNDIVPSRALHKDLERRDGRPVKKSP